MWVEKAAPDLWRILEDSLNEIYIFDAKTLRFIAVNRGGCENLGYSLNELRQLTPVDIKPEFTEETFAALIQPLCVGEQDQIRFRTIHLRKDGSRYPVEVHLQLSTLDNWSVFIAIILDITERERREQELAQANQLLQVIFDHSHVMVAYMDAEFNFLMVNRAYAEADERTPNDFIGKNHFDLYPNEDNQAIFQHVVESGRPHISFAHPFQYVHNPERGMTYWDWTLVPVKDSRGQVTGVVLTLQNVTERIKSVEALFALEKRFQGVVDSLEEAVFVLDPVNRHIITCNPATTEIFGYGEQELLGVNMSYLHIDQTTYDAFEQNMIVALDRGGPYHVECRMRCQNGQIIDTDNTVTEIVGTSGARMGIVHVVRDITEKKRAELALQESENNYRTLMEQASDGIFIADQKGNYVDVNSRGCELLGYTREEMLKLTLRDLLFEEDLIEAPLRIDELRQGKPILTERRLKRKNGAAISVELSAKMLEDGRLQGITRDITRRKQAEEALRKSEARYRSIFETTMVGILHTRMSDGKLLRYNDQLVKIRGYASREEFAAEEQSAADFYANPEDRIRLLELLKRDGEVNDFQMVALQRDGTPIWVSLSSRGYPELDLIEGAVLDITDRKRAEEALRQSEARYRNIYNNTQVGLVQTRLSDSQFIQCNTKFANLLGYDTAEELLSLGLSALDFYANPDDRAALLAALQQDGKVNDFEMRAAHRDGSHFWISFSASMFPEQDLIDGAVLYIDDRKRAERALRESEERYRSIFNNTQVGLVHSRIEDGKFIRCNDRLASILRFDSPEALIAADLSSLDFYADPEDRHRLMRALNQTGEVNDFEVPINLRDGTPIWVSFSARIYPERGFIESALIEITDRKRAEEALRENEERYRSIFNNLRVGIVQISVSAGSILQYNTQLVKILGYSSRKEFAAQGSPALDFYINTEDRVTMLKTIQEHGEITDFEIRVMRKDGTHIWVSMYARLYPEQGMLEAAVVDITERKQTEIALRESEERYRNIFNNTQAGIAYTRIQNGEYVRCNTQFANMLGYEHPEDLIEGKLSSRRFYADPEDRAKLLAAFERGEEVNDFQVPVIRRDGKLIWISMYARARPELDLIEAVSLDITERKQAAQERELLIAELEARNAEMERFTYTVSHDLKSPLFTIQGFLGLLEQDVLEGKVDKVRGDIQYLSDAAHKMKTLLDDLLELSRVGRLVNPPQAVPLEEVVHEAIDLVSGQIAKSGAQITIKSDMPIVWGDRARLLEVLQNLLDNAAKFMGDQPNPQIEIGARQAGEEVICHVKDNGIGIAPQYHEKVFGLFERLDQHQEGTGIGLALARRIIELHGGRIWIKSEENQRGSTFCFTLPVGGETTPHEA